MVDKIYTLFIPNTRAIDNGDGTYSVSVDVRPESNLQIEANHESFYFPEDTNETVTVVASAVDNAFSLWAEVVDNNAVTFSSKFVTKLGHITSILVEQANVSDKVYLLEIACGVARTIIGRLRFYVGTKFIGAVLKTDLRPPQIPIGCTVYYRMKCETGGATAVVSFRYHYH